MGLVGGKSQLSIVYLIFFLKKAVAEIRVCQILIVDASGEL